MFARHFRNSCHFARFRCVRFRERCVPGCGGGSGRRADERALLRAGSLSGTGLRKSHTYKLRLTLLSGARENGPGGTPESGNEWGHLTGLIYVQFGNRAQRYTQPYQAKRRQRNREGSIEKERETGREENGEGGKRNTYRYHRTYVRPETSVLGNNKFVPLRLPPRP